MGLCLDDTSPAMGFHLAGLGKSGSVAPRSAVDRARVRNTAGEKLCNGSVLRQRSTKMMKECTTTVAIVAILLCAIGMPARASALTPATTRSVSPVDAQGTVGSADAVFVVNTLEQARVQLALARLALEASSASNTRYLASRAQELWANVDSQLSDIANVLGLRTSAELDPSGRATLNRLRRLTAQAFGAAYQKVVEQHCEALLQRLERMDPQVNPRILFFVDDMLPRVGHIQLELHDIDLE
jgi:predicted outer membrane protein